MDRIAGLQDLQDEGLGGLAGRKQWTGWQDLQDEGLGLNWGLTMDRITGWQDYRIYRIEGCGLAGGCMDRIAGFRRLWQVSRSVSSE